MADSQLYIVHLKNPSVSSLQSLRPRDANAASRAIHHAMRATLALQPASWRSVSERRCAHPREIARDWAANDQLSGDCIGSVPVFQAASAADLATVEMPLSN
jgi:hypothetical protein